MRLRVAHQGDAYALWLWANDPDERWAAGNRPLIGWNEHRAWFAGQTGSPMWILWTADQQPVGCIRFALLAAGWCLSYVVAPEARRQGYGSALVRCGAYRLVSSDRWHGEPVYADVRAGNVPSHTIFQRLGWTATTRDTHTRYTAAVRRIAEEGRRCTRRKTSRP